MSPSLVDDELWELIAPLLPRCPRRYRHPGRRRLDDRQVLNGILFVLTTGIAWQRLPQELGFGSGMTCWRRLRDWQQAGVWQQLHELLLARLRQAGRLDLSRTVCDSASLRALLGSRLCVACADDHAADPTRSSLTAVMTPNDTDRRYAPAGSDRSSPNAEPSTDPDSAGNAGSSNEPSPGSTNTGASASGTNAAPTSTKPSSRSPAASSASNNSTARFVRRF